MIPEQNIASLPTRQVDTDPPLKENTTQEGRVSPSVALDFVGNPNCDFYSISRSELPTPQLHPVLPPAPVGPLMGSFGGVLRNVH
jgi:hypothetical protein